MIHSVRLIGRIFECLKVLLVGFYAIQNQIESRKYFKTLSQQTLSIPYMQLGCLVGGWGTHLVLALLYGGPFPAPEISV